MHLAGTIGINLLLQLQVRLLHLTWSAALLQVLSQAKVEPKTPWPVLGKHGGIPGLLTVLMDGEAPGPPRTGKLGVITSGNIGRVKTIGLVKVKSALAIQLGHVRRLNRPTVTMPPIPKLQTTGRQLVNRLALPQVVQLLKVPAQVGH